MRTTIRLLALITVFLAVGVAAPSALHGSAQQSSEQEALTKAQTEFYLAQTVKLKDRPGFWQSLKDSPATTLASSQSETAWQS